MRKSLKYIISNCKHWFVSHPKKDIEIAVSTYLIMENNQQLNGDWLGMCSNPDCLKEAPLSEFHENYRNKEAFNVHEQFESEQQELDNPPSPKKAKIKQELLEENEAKDMKIGHLENEIEELKKKLEERNQEVDPQVKIQIENNVRKVERDKYDVKEALLLNQNAHFQKMYEEQKEEN